MTTDHTPRLVHEVARIVQADPHGYAARPSRFRSQLTAALAPDPPAELRGSVHLLTAALEDHLPARLLADAPLRPEHLLAFADSLGQARGWHERAALSTVWVWAGALGLVDPSQVPAGARVVSHAVSWPDQGRPSGAPPAPGQPGQPGQSQPTSRSGQTSCGFDRAQLPAPGGVRTGRASEAPTEAVDGSSDPHGTELAGDGPHRAQHGPAAPPGGPTVTGSPAGPPGEGHRAQAERADFPRPGGDVVVQQAARAQQAPGWAPGPEQQPWPQPARLAAAEWARLEPQVPVHTVVGAFRGWHPLWRLLTFVPALPFIAAILVASPTGRTGLVAGGILAGLLTVPLVLSRVRTGLLGVSDDGLRFVQTRFGSERTTITWSQIQGASGGLHPCVTTAQGPIWLVPNAAGLARAIAARVGAGRGH